MIIQSITNGNFKANLYLYKLGYGYKIFTKINNKNTCVAQSCVYLFDKNLCYDRMIADLHNVMGITKDLFH